MKPTALIALLALAGSAAQANPAPAEKKYYVGHQDKFVNITFESNADVETIVGTTHTASGEMSVDLARGMGAVSLNVPVDSLRTGIDARDEHLRQPNWLDAEKFPHITFQSKKSSPVPGKKDQVEVVGDFSVHGVKKEITVVVSFKQIPPAASQKAGFGDGEWVKFATEFDVKLSDYGVQIPQGIVAKVSEVWKVKISLFAGSEKPE
jgi:polyisoprenoid-binding protein YceI